MPDCGTDGLDQVLEAEHLGPRCVDGHVCGIQRRIRNDLSHIGEHDRLQAVAA
jgi:hypothetical protein